MKVTETNLGFMIEAPKFTALFGGQKATLPNLQVSFEDFSFIRVKQTHGDISVLSEDTSLDYKIEADGHFTQKHKTALCISTADCTPVLIYDPTTGTVAGIHAGWRGVANRIVPKTLAELVRRGGDLRSMQVLIGPHIQMSSFEVSNTVRDEILSSIQATATHHEGLYHKDLDHEKSLVDLNQVLRTQLQESGIEFDNFYNLHIDTFTDPRFHSFRRDKEHSGRQLSFICKT
jgi:YfiH family protein